MRCKICNRVQAYSTGKNKKNRLDDKMCRECLIFADLHPHFKLLIQLTTNYAIF